jgi:hypothetical protein
MRSVSKLALVGWLLLLGVAVGHAGPLAGMDTPIGFFTNVASRLLKTQMNLDLTNIQIWPTNQYTPAVHRLLQVSANLYDATTNRAVPGMTNGLGFPSVFRPIFNQASPLSNAPIYICGYEEVTNADMAYPETAPLMLDPYDPNSRARFIPQMRLPPMFYGIPLVIGAKKGWPNFNEFAMQTDVQVARKLQFLRDQTGLVSQTNQMYLASITNTLGAMAWNSYYASLARNLEIVAMAQVTASVTNGGSNTVFTSSWGVTNYCLLNPWPGFASASMGPTPTNFATPLLTGFFSLTNSEYRFQGTPGFVGITGIFESNSLSSLPVPVWSLSMRTLLQVIIVDLDADRIVDYVNLDSNLDPTQPVLDITSDLMLGGDCQSPVDAHLGSMWCTNLSPNAGSTWQPQGVLNQIAICLGLGYPSSVALANWSTQYGDVSPEINFFRLQFGLSPLPGTTIVATYLTNVFYAPFVPTRDSYLSTRWQACDPLVHYTIPDLTDLFLPNTSRVTVDSPPSPNVLADFTLFNGFIEGGPTTRYRPWNSTDAGARATVKAPDTYQTATNIALKDPVALAVGYHPDGVGRSDDWNFPTNQTSGYGWIGQVHRGTPWQTIYLKSSSISATTWQSWVGTTNPVIAQQMQPTNDWQLASLLVPLLNTNAPLNLASPNQPGTAGWLALLNGLTVLTNSSSTELDTIVMSSNSSQAAVIAMALDTRRRSEPGGYFRGIGDILAEPTLSIGTPWLNLQSAYAVDSLTDEAVEMIPSQLLTLLRPDSIGSSVSATNPIQVQFSGVDAWQYGVATSSDLGNWAVAATNLYPTNGFFNFTGTPLSSSSNRYYRSVLMP